MEKMTIKVCEGPRQKARRQTIWERFDRLQRSLRPLRKGKYLKRGIHYGRKT